MKLKYVMEIVLLLVLIIAALDDFLTRSIHIIYIGAFFAGACCLQLISPQVGYQSIVLGVLLGVAIYIISYLGGGVIGSGDAYVLSMCGAFLGIAGNIQLFVRAIMLAGIYGGVVIIKDYLSAGRIEVRQRIPFVPFILSAYITILWGNKFFI